MQILNVYSVIMLLKIIASFSATQDLSLLPISGNFVILWVWGRSRKLPPPTEAEKRQAFSIPFPGSQGSDLYVGLSHSDASIWNFKSGASGTKTGGWPRWSQPHNLGVWQQQCQPQVTTRQIQGQGWATFSAARSTLVPAHFPCLVL